jgi:hypothetical protein
MFKTNSAGDRSRLSPNLVLRLVQRPGKKEIVVPLGAILASIGPQQNKRKNQYFKKPALVRTAHVQTIARRTAPQQVHAIVRHIR